VPDEIATFGGCEALQRRRDQFTHLVKGSRPGRTQERFQLCEGELDRIEDCHIAVRLLSQAVSTKSKYYVLANRALAVWDQQKAIEYYEKLEAMLPNNDDVLLALANLHADAGAYDKASSRFATLLERDPACVAVLLGTGRVRIDSGKADEALEFLNRALTVSIHRGND
jgi:tetratricopeptide (TPR) repeat protein